jgi:hypothetical protein
MRCAAFWMRSANSVMARCAADLVRPAAPLLAACFELLGVRK